MTMDERLNKIEDQIRSLKDAINHNNRVTRQVNEKIQGQVTELKKVVDEVKTALTARNAGLGDIFPKGFGL